MQDGKPQYLMLARKSPYKHLAEQFAMYSELEKLANNEKELPELKVLVIPDENRMKYIHRIDSVRSCGYKMRRG